MANHDSCHRAGLFRGGALGLALAVMAILPAGERVRLPVGGERQPLDIRLMGPRSEPVHLSGYGQIRYVAPQDGAELADEGTRERPWRSVVRAMAGIRDAGAGNRYALLVAEGTYPCHELQMKEFVDLYGGFDPASWKRDPSAHKSVLDGEQAGRVLLGANHARLDGFTVSRGQARGAGGAILCDGTSPLLINNIFAVNSAKTADRKGLGPDEPGPVSGGGAIACIHGAAPRIDYNIIAFNTTDEGPGGGILCSGKASPGITGNIFVGNITGLSYKDPPERSRGGAIACQGGSTALLVDNLMADNVAGGKSGAGAIYCGKASAPVILNNTITGNLATGDSGGGLLLDKEAKPIIEANVISSNRARTLGGGIALLGASEARLGNNIICGNKSSWGAGVGCLDASVQIMNGTICDNTAEEEGGGVYYHNTRQGPPPRSPKVTNTIVYSNKGQPVLSLDANLPEGTVTYCDVEGGYPGTGNINKDPRFVEDGLTGNVETMVFDRLPFQTRARVTVNQALDTDRLRGRLIRLGVKRSIIAQNASLAQTDYKPKGQAQEFRLWGDMTAGGINQPPVGFSILPSYHLQDASPCIGVGTSDGAPERDIDGQKRLSAEPRGRWTIDIGADQHMEKTP